MGGQMSGPMTGRLHQNLPDQLEATLKPLNPKVFDVETPDQMAGALAELERVEIEKGER